MAKARIPKPKAAKKMVHPDIGHMSRHQMFGMSVASGVTAAVLSNQANYHIAKHQVDKATGYYKRKTKSGKVITVKKSSNHGVGRAQNNVTPMPPQYRGGV